MRYLSYILNNRVVAQIHTNLTDDEAIDLDEMLRKNGIIGDNQELAITEDLNGEAEVLDKCKRCENSEPKCLNACGK